MAVMNEEERRHHNEMHDKIHDALRRGDDDEFDRLMTKVKFPAHSLMEMKQAWGADFIRESGFDTKLADEKYGAGWLDR